MCIVFFVEGVDQNLLDGKVLIGYIILVSMYQTSTTVIPAAIIEKFISIDNCMIYKSKS